MRFLYDSVRRLFAAVLAIVLLACAVEVGLRLYQVPAPDAYNHVGNEGWRAVPSRTTYLALPAASSGVMRHIETTGTTPWRINSLGQRGPEYTLPKPAGVLRIVCLGDETALGTGLAEEECFPARLQERLASAAPVGVEVINAGLPGGCPMTELIQYRRLLTPLVPDVVVWQIDVSDAEDDRESRAGLRLDPAGWPAAVVHPTLDVPPGALARYSDSLATFRWLERRIGRRLASPRPAHRGSEFQQQLAAWEPIAQASLSDPDSSPLSPLLQWKELFADSQVRLVVTYCPNAWQTAELLRLASQPGATSEHLKRPARETQLVADRLGAPFLDFTPVCLAHPQPAELFGPVTGRLSVAGQALYADHLASFLTQPTSTRPEVSAETQLQR